MAICGLWHQVTLPFLVWGVLHGVGLAVHQLWRSYIVPHLQPSLLKSDSYRYASWLATHAFVSFAWVFFFPLKAALGVHVEYLKFLFAFQ
jgi:D-alanyl-lipoteichoic acid acyltransferase DltB (MBOAT superfamily)